MILVWRLGRPLIERTERRNIWGWWRYWWRGGRSRWDSPACRHRSHSLGRGVSHPGTQGSSPWSIYRVTEWHHRITSSQSYSHFVIVPVPAIDGGDLEGPPGDLCGEAGTVLWRGHAEHDNHQSWRRLWAVVLFKVFQVFAIIWIFFLNFAESSRSWGVTWRWQGEGSSRPLPDWWEGLWPGDLL